LARSEFTTESGAITGDALLIGGNWTVSTGSDTDDFSVAAGVATRTSVSDSGAGVTWPGRVVTAGATAYAAITAGLDVKASALNGAALGVVTRCTDNDNMLVCFLQTLASAPPITNLYVYAIVGGTATLGVVYPQVSFLPGQVARLSLSVDASGAWEAGFNGMFFLSGSHSALATGGALATGKVGIADYNVLATACTRTYDNFAASAFAPDAVCFASQSLELATQGITRKDSTGAAFGPVSIQTGDIPRMPNRSSAGVVEFFAKASRGDLQTITDPNIDDISVRVYRRASHLLIPN
jgi:hypothetical protein